MALLTCSFGISNLHNGKTIPLSGFKPTSLWHFVMAALEQWDEETREAQNLAWAILLEAWDVSSEGQQQYSPWAS